MMACFAVLPQMRDADVCPCCCAVFPFPKVAADLVDCDRLDVTFEDIAGMEGVKRSLQDIISEPLDFPPELYPVSVVVYRLPIST